jgi:hypothetical protein
MHSFPGTLSFVVPRARSFFSLRQTMQLSELVASLHSRRAFLGSSDAFTPYLLNSLAETSGALTRAIISHRDTISHAMLWV